MMSDHHSYEQKPLGRDWTTTIISSIIVACVGFVVYLMADGGMGPSMAGMGLWFVRIILTILQFGGWVLAIVALIIGIIMLLNNQPSAWVLIVWAAMFFIGWLYAAAALQYLAPYHPGDPVWHRFI